LTRDSRTVSWDAIRRFHTSWRHHGRIVTAEKAGALKAAGEPVVRPWRDIGYHFGIELIDDHYEILTGRPMTEPGAHCAMFDMNSTSLGICCVGNFDHASPPDAQWTAALELVLSLMDIFSIPADLVYGHGEIDARKTCPGRRFDMERFRRHLNIRRKELRGTMEPPGNREENRG
jgi:N-acetylmuramoyl-L-alanine amidase